MLWTNNVYYEDQQKLDDVLFSKLQTHRKLPPIITFAHNNLHGRFCLRIKCCGLQPLKWWTVVILSKNVKLKNNHLYGEIAEVMLLA